jgi:hypothetical protein
LNVTVGVETASLVTGWGKLTTAPAGLVASTDWVEGQVRLGAVVSFTVREKAQLRALPAASVVVTLTEWVPSAKVLPEAGLNVTVGVETASLVTGREKLTTAPAGLVASTVRAAGQVRLGAVVSLTTAVSEQETVLPALSVTVAETGVEPIGKRLPEAGV